MGKRRRMRDGCEVSNRKRTEMHPARRELLTTITAMEVVRIPEVIEAATLVVAAVALIVRLYAKTDEATVLAAEADPELHGVVRVAERQIRAVVFQIDVLFYIKELGLILPSIKKHKVGVLGI